MGHGTPEPIAIVGSGCRLPGGADSPSSLWRVLETAPDLRSEISNDRFNTVGFYHPNGARHGSTNVRHAYLLDEDVRTFDAAFFNINANEAESMDPQQRILLETVYEALEAGGHPLTSLRGSDTSVYVGTMTVDYLDTLLRDHNTIPQYFATGINRAVISNRVSYFFDWHGPSMTIDTACSSSLIAVHLAVQSLRSRESQVSVACGTQILLGYDMYIGESKLKMLSPNGRSRMWDSDADGYARGEGVTAIVMKRLSDAIRDGDHIECIIRETGANQDGASNGLTVPSSEAQADLIRQTYARAGLSPADNPYDRPQYFEAHGTGTQMGDPKEAAAIHDVFGRHICTDNGPLYVGSVKTIVGHLEGAAGLAGVLKASACLQHGTIPPNRSFRQLNPKIKPYYQGLEVPTHSVPWPALPNEVPRRASVNSFGFGGANAHAILEEFTAPTLNTSDDLDESCFIPFVFSAHSETSLVALLKLYAESLKKRICVEKIRNADLSWTLCSRKSQFQARAAFPASSIARLVVNIEDKIAAIIADSTNISLRPNRGAKPRLLGIFTGQGAQWPAMSADLIRSSKFVSDIVQHLEASLSTLPEVDRPNWSLRREMLANAGNSRIAEAALSQPLCTAVQIILVDLLQAAGIVFSAVVGHSSGEIAAAYAAGFISARDAIRIAYYRGLYANLAGNITRAQGGAMLAIGASFEEAQKITETFHGRIAVAAHNSSASVTLSGDADAIAEVKKMFEEQKRFARLLRVDTAYHSHHMLPCAERYVTALRSCGIKVNSQPNTTCSWFSSVTADRQAVKPNAELADLYWRDNMSNTVLFAEAIKNAVLNDSALNAALEIGPHPALKGPAEQNMADVSSDHILYSGVMIREKNDVESFSSALAFLWTIFGSQSIDLMSFNNIMSPDSSHRLVVNLPSYRWDHSRAYWHESRRSAKIRSHKDPPHELLGILSPDSTAHDRRWLNVLKVSEIPWLEGHRLQGLVVLPASGFVAMAVEAARISAGEHAVRLIEVHELSISRAVTFKDEDLSGTEILVTLTSIEYEYRHTMSATFAVYADLRPGTDRLGPHDLELVAKANIKVLLGDPDLGALPYAETLQACNMTQIDSARVYDAFSRLGYGYTGPFKTLSSIKRKLNYASATVSTYAYAEDESTSYAVHPALLDVAIQSAMVAYASPSDGHLWSLHVPTEIRNIRINPHACVLSTTVSSRIPITTVISDSRDFSANIDMFSEEGHYGMVQVEQMILSPLAPATSVDDRHMFSHTQLGPATPDLSSLTQADPTERFSGGSELETTCDATSFHYLYKWRQELANYHLMQDSQLSRRHLVSFLDHFLSTAETGRHPFSVPKASDREISSLQSKYSCNKTLSSIVSFGEELLAVLRGQDAAPTNMNANASLIARFKHEMGFDRCRSLVADVVKQITFRYPHASILELGGARICTTDGIREETMYHSINPSLCTITDPSSDVVEKLSKTVHKHNENTVFRVLDIQQDLSAQGIVPHSYDIIVAYNALNCASTPMQKALENVRELLKPGGYLVLMNNIGARSIGFATWAYFLTSWCLDSSRDLAISPIATTMDLHSTLRKAGFGGIDTTTLDADNPSLCSVFAVVVAQAINDQILFLRQPLSAPSLPSTIIRNLVILGTRSLASCRIAEKLAGILGRFCDHVVIFDGLPTKDEADAIESKSTFINLVDLDTRIFEKMTEDKVVGLKAVFNRAKSILWVTRGVYLGEEPHHAASLAFCRSLANEASHVDVNTLDIPCADPDISQAIAEQLLRQCALEKWNDRHILWSNDSEAVLSRERKLLLPRILPSPDRNMRLNAIRRRVMKKVPISGSNISVESEATTFSSTVYLDCPAARSPHFDTDSVFNAEYSTMNAIRTLSEDFLFISVGRLGHGTQTLIAASTTNSQPMLPVVSIPVMSDVDTFDEGKFLVAVVCELLATSLLEKVMPGSKILVHCSKQDRILARVIAQHAAVKDVGVHFSCIAGSIQDQTWIELHPHSSRHVLHQRLKHLHLTHILDLTVAYSDAAGNASIDFAGILPIRYSEPRLSDLCQRRPLLQRPLDYEMLTERLQAAVVNARSSLSAVCDIWEQSLLQLDHIQSNLAHQHVTGIISWPKNGSIEACVRPMGSSPLLSREKTYVLFGLSGQIGQSLCEWMVTQGAGCVVLTSRNPIVDPRWIDSFRHSGTNVKVMRGDITDRKSLETLLEAIKASCPPIGGIANGANSLCDAPFDTLSAEHFNRVLEPKITGSYNLDQAFYDDDLEFFILLSSISCVIGTAGQSNYAAANGFQSGLARQRRKRGLRATALDLGLVLGIGLAEAAGQSVVDSLQKYGITPLSEPDIRLVFAESIIAGYTEARDTQSDYVPDAVLTSGLRSITMDEREIVWYENPIFSHLVNTSGVNRTRSLLDSKTSSVSIEDQIATATSMEQGLNILKECFLARLGIILGGLDMTTTYDTPLIELGIDSLGAADVRSWFLKSLKVDMPILKLLAGSTLEDICMYAYDNLSVKPVVQNEDTIHSSVDSIKADDSVVSNSQAESSCSESTDSRSSSFTAMSPPKSQASTQLPVSATTQRSLLPPSTLARDISVTDTQPVRTVPISIGQSRFWFLRRLVEDPTTFNVTLKFRITGRMDSTKLDTALDVVIARHESLRTCFTASQHEADEAYQCILARSNVRLEHRSVNSIGEVEREYAELRSHEFNLSSGPLLRVVMLTLSPTIHFLLINYDHIIMDMASFQIFTAEVDKAYIGQPLEPESRQYPDFAVQQLQDLRNGDTETELQYWRKVFPAGEELPILPLLPMSRSSSRTAVAYDVHQATVTLDPAVAAKIKAVAKASQCTPFHFYLTAFKTMLLAFTDVQDIIIGIADANRNDSHTVRTIGFFLNLLPLRFRRVHQSFSDGMKDVRTIVYGALGNSRLPFDILLKEFNVARSSLCSPFFQAFFDYRQQSNDRRTWCDCQLDLEELHPGRTAYDISLDVADLGADVSIALRVQKSLYDSTAAKLLLETYKHFVTTFARDVSVPLDDIPLFSSEQLLGSIAVGLGPDLTSNWPSTLPHRIDQIAKENSNSTALVDGHGNSMTFAAMTQRVEAIADALRRGGTKSESRVLVFQDATADWICSLLAIMRVGGVYVPLDLRNPIDRLASQASHCQAVAVLVDDTTVFESPKLHVEKVYNVSRIANDTTNRSPGPNLAQPDQLAAILYTSGSTGTPKGILIRHSSIQNQMEGYTKTYKLGAERVLQQSAFTFDFSMDQIFTGLTNGGMLYIVPMSERGDPLSITKIMKDQSITYTKVTPSEYSMWMQYGAHELTQATEWRFAFAGGEPLSKTILQQFTDLSLERLALYNSYGPAEISIASHKGLIDYRERCSNKRQDDDPIVCGFSLPNYATYILDEHKRPLPIGMPGEVVIGGAGVSSGYVNNQELTDRKFIPNPFATSLHKAHGWTSMHCTGDIGYLQEDGSLVFRNRIEGDTQIKLRGLRIDLRDIEASIVSAAEGTLEEAVVTLRAGDPEFLVAHVVFSTQAAVNNKDIFLRQLLGRLPIPQYMMPMLAIPLDKIPLTNHCKVDRRAVKNIPLPQLNNGDCQTWTDDAEEIDTSHQLQQIWRELLPNAVGRGLTMNATTDFFEIGGNSLLAVRLQSRIRRHFNVALRLVDLLSKSQLIQMARKIEESPIVDPLDWEMETEPPSSRNFLKDITRPGIGIPSGGKTVIVTGSTGNLATFILPILSADPRIGEINCIAVRNRPRETDSGCSSTSKLVVHEGDLSLPLLGLSEALFRDLASRADVILHLGATRSFWDNYNILRATNVDAIKELIVLAAPRQIPIHFISSSEISHNDEAATMSSSSPPPTDGSNGYLATKWACERLLVRAAARPGIGSPGFVHRLLPFSPSSASSHGPTLSCRRSHESISPSYQDPIEEQSPKQQVLNEFARCAELANAIPDLDSGWVGSIDLISGKSLAKRLCDSILESCQAPCASVAADYRPQPQAEDANREQCTVRFIGYESTVSVEVQEIMEKVRAIEEKRTANEIGNDFDRVHFLTWMGRIKARGFQYILAAQKATVTSKVQVTTDWDRDDKVEITFRR